MAYSARSFIRSLLAVAFLLLLPVCRRCGIANAQRSLSFGQDTGFYPAGTADEDVLDSLDFGVREIFGSGVESRIISAKKKIDDGTHFEIVLTVKTPNKSICKVMLMKVVDRQGELFMERYDTLLDNSC